MGRFQTFINMLLGILLWGCESQPIPIDTPKTIGDIQSRGIITNTILPEGSEALFNATGGLAFTNQIFAFTNSIWTNTEVSLEPSSSQETTLTALYPAYNDEQTLITEHPYSGNALQDVLIAQHKFTGPTEISLEFKHLFAQLTLHVESAIKNTLTEVLLKAPKIDNIIGTDGTFTTSGEHTTSLPKNDTGNYTFIIPPVENCNITLTFRLSDASEVSHTLIHTFTNGYKYECNVTDADSRPGIRTADDLIDFSKYINGDISKDQWSRFGYIESNDTIYPLLNDITLTDDDNSKLSLIGDHQQTPFSGIFDGNNHTISKLKISASNGFAGLFGIITHTGYVKRLHLDNCSSESIDGSADSGVGLLAGVCYGTITNCSASNNTITVNIITPTGGLIGHLRAGGNVINSCVQNTTITSTGYIGGIAGEVKQANIINCYVASNQINASTYCGGFAGYTNQTNITNCYKYKITFNTSKKRGQVIGSGKDSSIDYIFYDLSNQLLINEKNDNTSTQTNYEQYNTDNFKTTNGDIELYKRLNQWIDTQEETSHAFTLWKSSSDLPAVFQ